MAASDPTMAVPTPTGALQGVAACNWDGIAWQPVGRAGPAVATPTGGLQGVAPFSWDGSAWQPVGRAVPGVATPSGVLDGVAVYTWSGSAWVPAGGTATPSTPTGALRGVAAFSWDGSAWQPAAQAGPSVATPYGVLQGVAMFNWTGSAWAAASAGPPGVTLDLSFMTPGTLPSGVTFTRASTATYFDSTGTLQTATTNAPRWDYDPVTHALRGLLIEEARTNLLLNSATLGTQSVTTTAVATTLSFYGTGTVTLSGTATGSLVGTGAFPTRVSMVFTPTAGTLTLTVTGSVLNAQLEATVSAFPTSYIPTTAASVTRAADNAAIPTTGWFTLGPSSLAAELMLSNTVATNRDACVITDGTTTNRLGLRPLASGIGAISVTSISGTTTTSASFGTASANVPAKMASSWSGTTNLGCLNAGSVVSTSVGLPPALNVLTIGNVLAGSLLSLNGWVRRVRYWPRVLSNAELQSVTT